MGVERNADDHTATWRHGVHERRITRLGIDEFAASIAAKRELKAQRIQNFPEDDLIGRNALAVRDLLFEGVRVVARIPGDPGQRLLNCLHRERRRAEGVFIERETRETGYRRRYRAGRRRHRTDRRKLQTAKGDTTEQFSSCPALRSG